MFFYMMIENIEFFFYKNCFWMVNLNWKMMFFFFVGFIMWWLRVGVLESVSLEVEFWCCIILVVWFWSSSVTWLVLVLSFVIWCSKKSFLRVGGIFIRLWCVVIVCYAFSWVVFFFLEIVLFEWFLWLFRFIFLYLFGFWIIFEL